MHRLRSKTERWQQRRRARTLRKWVDWGTQPIALIFRGFVGSVASKGAGPARLARAGGKHWACLGFRGDKGLSAMVFRTQWTGRPVPGEHCVAGTRRD